MTRIPFSALAAGAVVLGCLAAPAPAHAWVRWGVGIGVPVYPPPAYYYPPPPVVVVPPPAVTYVQPPPTSYVQQPTYGQSCDAGPYVCPTQHPLALGSACACPGHDGPVGGTVR